MLVNRLRVRRMLLILGLLPPASSDEEMLAVEDVLDSEGMECMAVGMRKNLIPLRAPYLFISQAVDYNQTLHAQRVADHVHVSRLPVYRV